MSIRVCFNSDCYPCPGTQHQPPARQHLTRRPRLGRRRHVARLLFGLGLTAAGSAMAQAPGPKITERELLARFNHEPTVRQVQQAAIRYYQVHPDRIRNLRANARLKALVPTISGEFSTELTHALRKMHDGLYRTLDFKEDEGANADRIGVRVQASWILDRLVFNAEVLDVQSLIGILDGVVREVTTVYYIRRRLQIDMILRPPPDLATRISQRIRVEELTGLLDAMTGGFMTKMVAQGLRKKRGG